MESDNGVWVLCGCGRNDGLRQIIETFDDEAACKKEQSVMVDERIDMLFWCEFYGSRVEFEHKNEKLKERQLVFEFEPKNGEKLLSP